MIRDTTVGAAAASDEWASAKLGHMLSTELLQNIYEHFGEMDKAGKMGVLFAMLYVRKGDIMRMQAIMDKIYAAAEADPNEWIHVTARILKNALTRRQLNTHVETWSPSFGDVVDKIESAVKQQGISFHPLEYALLTKDAQPQCPYASKVYRSNEPTNDEHFRLNPTAMANANSHRQKVFQSLLKQQPSSDAAARRSTSPPSSKVGGPMSNARMRPGMMPTAAGAGAVNSRPMMAAGRATGAAASGLFITRNRPAPGASSLFISNRGRKPSLGAAPSSIPRMPQEMAPRPPPSPSDATPKGFIRPSRVQMIDFNEQTTLQQHNARNIEDANQKLQAEREARKEQAAEKRRLDAERRRQEVEENRRRVREERELAAAEREPKRQRQRVQQQ